MCKVSQIVKFYSHIYKLLVILFLFSFSESIATNKNDIISKLSENGFENIPIMSYSAKYSSSFYGPFREAAQSTPSFGDRKTYQMDYRNSNEAVFESELDIEEGADIIMVKPALSYCDIIYNGFGRLS